MAGVKTIISETKAQVKKQKENVNNAERLINLLDDFGVPVAEQRAQLSDMKAQVKRMDTGLKNDKKFYEDV